jgi:hypothetical protein
MEHILLNGEAQIEESALPFPQFAQFEGSAMQFRNSG